MVSATDYSPEEIVTAINWYCHDTPKEKQIPIGSWPSGSYTFKLGSTYRKKQVAGPTMPELILKRAYLGRRNGVIISLVPAPGEIGLDVYGHTHWEMEMSFEDFGKHVGGTGFVEPMIVSYRAALEEEQAQAEARRKVTAGPVEFDSHYENHEHYGMFA